MGLAERRMIAKMKEQFENKTERLISKEAGTELKFEVDWDSIVKEDNLHYIEEAFDKIFVQPLVEAFKSICSDGMGKKAVKEGLKKVVIRDHDKTGAGDLASSMEDQTLTIDHKITNLDDLQLRIKGFTSTLEKNL